MKTALAMVVGAMLVVGCGGSTETPQPSVDGMWTTAGGALTCLNAVMPPKIVNDDPFLVYCAWACVEIDGYDYKAVAAYLRQADGAWAVDTVNWLPGECH